ncbi:MAG TPA: DUF411 domain-containing protein [Longimicrobiales bacterium]|nr:DUF411 domain-containing protein [Longimicrobiales bacterium]
MRSRTWLVLALALGGVGLLALRLSPAPRGARAEDARTGPPVAITVYKSPSCGCCGQWVEHLKKSGFAVTVVDVDDVMPVKQKYGVPGSVVSCHTARVGGYVVEGHVPADLIRKLLRERPNVAGIAAPGMPVGAPGMEQGGRKEPYDVVAFDRSGRTTPYARR